MLQFNVSPSVTWQIRRLSLCLQSPNTELSLLKTPDLFQTLSNTSSEDQYILSLQEHLLSLLSLLALGTHLRVPMVLCIHFPYKNGQCPTTLSCYSLPYHHDYSFSVEATFVHCCQWHRCLASSSPLGRVEKKNNLDLYCLLISVL